MTIVMGWLLGLAVAQAPPAPKPGVKTPGIKIPIERLQPDAVLLDIGLPGLDGYQVAERLRAQPAYRKTLVVAVSGYGQEEDRVRSKAAGFDYHVVKPIDPGVINGLLSSLRESRAPLLLPENVVHFPARRAVE